MTYMTYICSVNILYASIDVVLTGASMAGSFSQDGAYIRHYKRL